MIFPTAVFPYTATLRGNTSLEENIGIVMCVEFIYRLYLFKMRGISLLRLTLYHAFI